MAGAGPNPQYTECEFKNNTSTGMIYKDSHVWNGLSIPSDICIDAGDGKHFRYTVSGIGSIGAVVLTQNKTPPQLKWIVAWSNKVDSDNQVYISLKHANDNVDWEVIKANLDSSTNHSTSDSSKADIDLKSNTPSMKAELPKKLILRA